MDTDVGVPHESLYRVLNAEGPEQVDAESSCGGDFADCDNCYDYWWCCNRSCNCMLTGCWSQDPICPGG